MPARQSIDFGECIVDTLRVERPSTLEEGVLVAEVAVLRTPACNHDRVRDEIHATMDQIPPDRWQPVQGPARGRHVPAQRAAGSEIIEKLRKRLLAWTKEDGVSVRRGLVRQGGDVQAAEDDEHTLRAVGIGEGI